MSESQGWPYRMIMPRLIGGGPNEGAVVHVKMDSPVGIGRREENGDWVWIDLVSTGEVVWVGERPVEVWVPEDRLEEWRSERGEGLLE